ncbi:LLM class flavin-dependent oxidoreductase [Bacillus benzoevorans]|uniref:Luciferase family oxidoreductase group 1 n=1 Tax=Bacillus benzoevorans TaxID=1456 RepID=A0A7X0HSK7_9BACI|nr:LLM class flavin-dependent oxidoreductase [Bacillus benzoevorans]MBB6444935.1 luciferase family oxidoreductase group 1 [Bacillus benzoevorans]
MKLSILDQSPISSDQTAQDALYESMKLAQAGEELGYTRYWIAEHHNLPGLACPAPEVMLSYIGAHTNTIRIGAGAVLLPHYKPFKVAEVYNMLATLFPGRIDVGIGRAPGGSAEATNALSENFLQEVWKVPEKVEDLVRFLEDDYPTESGYVKLSASPVPPIAPAAWLLGTGKKSAMLAAEKGLPYAFGLFMSDQDGSEMIREYRERFRERKQGEKPQVMLTVSVICAETTEEAEELALSTLIWSLRKANGQGHGLVPSIKEVKQYVPEDKEKEALEKMKQKMIIGSPNVVKERLTQMQQKYRADEIMLVTITHSPEAKRRSYELIAKACGLKK